MGRRRADRVRVAAALCLPGLLLVTCDAPDRDRSAPARREARARPEGAPRPPVVERRVWRADEGAVREKPLYTGPVQAVFVHHTLHSNNYDCATDVPAMLLSMERHHINGMGWDDLGYNFVVDRCGTIYEGRAGGVDRAVKGAHTKGFNERSVGIAALGHFEKGEPVPARMLRAMAAVAAWKLGPGVDPRGRTRLVSSSDGSRYPEGTQVELSVISGHRDEYDTTCPGDALYDALPRLREETARLRPGPGPVSGGPVDGGPVGGGPVRSGVRGQGVPRGVEPEALSGGGDGEPVPGTDR
ncbi:peptidoglycan recognition protein [Streptomyces sp. JV176]|uniref:peptidoglycan recognition protein family protein n=1 Tax=Streptomyces sp. JV176 TaxID=858630 RepID=UPI002E77CBB6|nr:peptidoglycan recognition protein [Streptomyces sp. JV176]MEE1798195.1 peptidoglycan recognition protein [Streptomyces sp. JV176]